ncbi:hypothetical protein PAESOLCIP111_00977 [Paenibacillus solanacearum]|uniref:DoxX family protein n=1 Tax=Paenibacillus solanacearum TaxID=2048548 RepID=A0A916JWM3_9BACL|nr:hypothetical protein [Paenibacillus solanacearum]CAG7607611.1 hypothetical protein PAESOLCIP111_00977 [Paenibacillus solanacearum]
MIPFIVMVGTFILLYGAGLSGWSYMSDWHTPLQYAVAAMLLIAASAHWGKRRPDLIRMVPAGLPRPGTIVTLTGLAEIAGALLLLYPPTAYMASIGLALLLVAMFPANVRAARSHITLGGRAPTPLGLRTALQFVFIAAILLAG